MKVSRSAKTFSEIFESDFSLGIIKAHTEHNIKFNEIVNLIKLLQCRFQLGIPLYNSEEKGEKFSMVNNLFLLLLLVWFYLHL